MTRLRKARAKNKHVLAIEAAIAALETVMPAHDDENNTLESACQRLETWLASEVQRANSEEKKT